MICVLDCRACDIEIFRSCCYLHIRYSLPDRLKQNKKQTWNKIEEMLKTSYVL